MFWYETTWRQALNISEGYRRKQKNDYEKHAFIHRTLQVMVYNFLSGKKVSAEEFMPLDMDGVKPSRQNNSIGFSIFKQVFEAVYADRRQ